MKKKKKGKQTLRELVFELIQLIEVLISTNLKSFYKFINSPREEKKRKEKLKMKSK